MESSSVSSQGEDRSVGVATRVDAATRVSAAVHRVPAGEPEMRSAQALKGVPLLRELGTRHLQAIAEMGRLHRYAAGEIVFEEGDPGESLHLIAEGVTRVVRLSPDGGEVLIARLGPGEVLGELALIDGGARSATAIAEGDSAHVLIPHERFHRWLAGEPSAATALLRTLVGRLRATDESLYSITLQPLSERVARLLLDTADAHGSVRITQSEIARRLGVTRESVNKHLRRLEANNVLTIGRARCEIRDRRALEVGAGR